MGCNVSAEETTGQERNKQGYKTLKEDEPSAAKDIQVPNLQGCNKTFESSGEGQEGSKQIEKNLKQDGLSTAKDIEVSLLGEPNKRYKMDLSEWWQRIDRLLTKEEPFVVPDEGRNAWRTVRLFVSSTFKDFKSERNYLVKQIFPQLRAWCEERKLRLIEVDLRWGVPRDSDTKMTLLTCLSEIERCREENGFPYFLSMLSERYGWVPEPEEVPDDIKARYNWEPGMSVTSWEVFTGSYWERNPNALVLMRDSSYLQGITDDEYLQNYVETDEETRSRLESLKDQLRKVHGEHVMDYTCTVDGDIPRKKLVKLTGFEAMGERVLEHFKSALTWQYPTSGLDKTMTTQEVQRLEHEMFLIQRSNILLGRDKEVDDMRRYITDEMSSSLRPLVLAGKAGAGKSALVAYTAKWAKAQQEYKVFYHFVGATPKSTDLTGLLARIWYEVMPPEEPAPTDPEELRWALEHVLKQGTRHALSRSKTRLILFIDALNQLDETGNTHELLWLRTSLPVACRVIVSTLEGTCLDSLRKRTPSPSFIEVNPLGLDTRQEIITKLLREYNKRLDSTQMACLVGKEDAGRPLYLSVAVEELRVHGSSSTLLAKMQQLPQDLQGLLSVVLQRIVADYGGDLVTATLCLIETSRFGLLETELLGLLACSPVVPLGAETLALEAEPEEGEEEEEEVSAGKLSMAQWAFVYIGLRQFLRPCGKSGEGRLDFYHRTISKVVRSDMLGGDEDKRWWHTRLAEYFQDCGDLERQAEELPYHLEVLEDKEGMQQLLLTWPVFRLLNREETRQQLMAYWRFAGGYAVAAEKGMKALDKYIEAEGVPVKESVRLRIELAYFLVEIGEYQEARDYGETIISIITESCPSEKASLAETYYVLTLLNYREALTCVYGSHPIYKRCRKEGGVSSTKCMQLYEEVYKSDKFNTHYADVLTTCGFFQGEALDMAKEIYSKLSNKRGLSVVLHMQGGKNQYNADINVPTKLFKESIELSENHLGHYNLHSARAYQLYGQMLWNRWCQDGERKKLENCLDPYLQELDILETLLGPLHPNTVRSREDCIIVTSRLGKSEQCEALKAQQPQGTTELISEIG